MSMSNFRRLAAKIDQHMQQLAAQGVSPGCQPCAVGKGWTILALQMQRMGCLNENCHDSFFAG